MRPSAILPERESVHSAGRLASISRGRSLSRPIGQPVLTYDAPSARNKCTACDSFQRAFQPFTAIRITNTNEVERACIAELHACVTGCVVVPVYSCLKAESTLTPRAKRRAKRHAVHLADTERNERQAFKRQQFSAAKSEMAYHNYFVLNNLGGDPKSALPVFPLPPRDVCRQPVYVLSAILNKIQN
jgi:hypothetical protein